MFFLVFFGIWFLLVYYLVNVTLFSMVFDLDGSLSLTLRFLTFEHNREC